MEQTYEDDSMIKSTSSVPCWICKEPTAWYEINFQAPICSEECLKKANDDYAKVEVREKDFLDYVREAQSLGEVCGLYAQYKIKKREMNWVDGDAVQITVDKFGDSKETYGKLAETGMGTVKHLQQIERVSRAFAGSEERDTTYPWSMYRAAYQAAMRMDPPHDPFEVFAYGVGEGWHTKDFRKYGRPEEMCFVLKCICPMCGFKFTIEGDKFITATLKCPVCETEGEMTLLPGEFQRKD